TEGYRQIWAAEGPRIIAAMEKATNLQFRSAPVRWWFMKGPVFPATNAGQCSCGPAILPTRRKPHWSTNSAIVSLEVLPFHPISRNTPQYSFLFTMFGQHSGAKNLRTPK